MSLTVRALLREDLRSFGGYQSARSQALSGDIWLNANESAWANPSDAQALLRRYPQPQPDALREQLARLYNVRQERLLLGRGSDEGIDLLLRAFCTPGKGAIVTAPPVFGMYAVCAKLHGARVVEVPLRDAAQGLVADLDAMAVAALKENAALVFVCSPGNPSGELVALDRIEALARKLQRRALVVVDEAYLEYANTASASSLLDTCDNIAVLRTLSKAHALAGARVGCVLGQAPLIEALRRCQAPYPIAQPVEAAALAALSPQALTLSRSRMGAVCEARSKLAAGLAKLAQVRRVYPSQGNFLLVRFNDVDTAFASLLAAGIVVRDMRSMPQLSDALRITVGSIEECRRVLAALGSAVLEGAA